MPSPPILDIAALLASIPGENPSGRSLAYEPEYDKIREARRSEDDSLAQGEWKRGLKSADWDLVIALCADCLTNKSKDLQLAAWLTEGLLRTHGFAGLRDGLELLKELQENFWETYFPEIDDGDLESRHGPFLFLNDQVKGLPFLIRGQPLTHGFDDQKFGYFDYLQSRETDNLIKKDPENERKILATGRFTAKTFDDAVAQTPKIFYANLVADLKAAQAAFQAFDHDTDERFGRDAPSLLEIGKSIAEVLRLVEPILVAKRQAEPDPEPKPEPVPALDTGEADETPPTDGPPTTTEGTLVLNGVAIPKRRLRLGTPQESEAPDFGRILIDFHDRAQALAEAGARLTENRQKYAELLAELQRLDDEYEELSNIVSRDREAYPLLTRLLKGP